jgi:hypothetical protein
MRLVLDLSRIDLRGRPGGDQRADATGCSIPRLARLPVLIIAVPSRR